ncbi:MAG: SDR family NAD(P)-dependent oxidoreductase [Opitutaceae bacterium]
MSPEEMLRSFRTLIITGGSSGIGKSFIEHAIRYNPKLEIFNLSRRKPEVVVIPGQQLKLRHFPCDLADKDQVERTCLELGSELDREIPAGRMLLINNSGYGTYGSFPEPNLARTLEMMDVNMRAPVELAGRLLPRLRAQGGAIINVASTAAFQPTATMAAYGATKAFLLHWSLALSEELRGSPVQVLAVCPGPTSTAFFRNAGLEHPVIPAFLGQTADEVVEASYRALASGRSLVTSGWKNKVGTFLVSKLPKVLAAKLAARVVARFRPVGERPRHG